MYPLGWLRIGWILLVVSGGGLLFWSTLFCTHVFCITLFKLLCHRCLTTLRRDVPVVFKKIYIYIFKVLRDCLSLCDIYCLSLLINSWSFMHYILIRLRDLVVCHQASRYLLHTRTCIWCSCWVVLTHALLHEVGFHADNRNKIRPLIVFLCIRSPVTLGNC